MARVAIQQRDIIKLYPAFATDSNSTMFFFLGPKDISRRASANYSEALATGVDYTNGKSIYQPNQWINNRPQEITMSIMICPEAASFSGAVELSVDSKKKYVERQINLLESFMEIDVKLGEPPDLVLSIGKRSFRVKLMDYKIDERLYFNDLSIMQAMASLTFKTTNGDKR